jgi:hypothetical protein
MFPVCWSQASSILLAILVLGLYLVPHVFSETGTEFSGTVLTVDMSAGKFAVKKEGGGTRFTFVANEKTTFEGGPKSIKDLKKDDKVAVFYQVQGSQYLALRVTKK